MKLLDKLYYPNLKPGLPRTIMIEPTNACNLKCRMCDYQRQFEGQRSYLSMDDFNAIIGQFPKINGLIFCGLGEPLLNKSVVEMIAAAREKKIPFINLITNGIMLDGACLESLINSGLSRIQISFHSTDPGIAARINGASAETHALVRSNILNAVRSRDKAGSNLCIVLNSVLNTENYDDAFSLIGFCEANKIDEINFIQLTTVFGKYDSFNISKEKARSLMKRIRSRLKRSKVKMSFLSASGAGRCYQLWDFIMVHSDGNISPCNGIMPHENKDIGNLIHDNISRIWHSDKYLRLRESVIAGRLKNCNYCEVGYPLEGRDPRWFNNHYLKPLIRNLYSYIRDGRV